MVGVVAFAVAYGKASTRRRLAAYWDSFVTVGRYLKGALGLEGFKSLLNHELTELVEAVDREADAERKRSRG